MPNIQERYVARTHRSGVAPSGQEFKWRAPTALEFGAIVGGVPGLMRNSSTGPDEATIERAIQYNRKLALACVTSPVLVEDEAEAPASGEWLPVDALTQGDMAWLAVRISEASNMDSDKAELARGAL